MKHTSKARTAAITVALIAAVCSGCGDDDEEPVPPAFVPTTPTSTGTASPGGAATVAARSSKLGRILVDGKGRTLYLFEADKSEKSTCSGACAQAWPPLTTSGKPKTAQGVKPDLIGTSPRDDGSTGVTYNGHPLYYYQGDKKPGDTNGQELDQFGAEWYVLNADGNKVEGKGTGEDGGGY
ncbi:hypothetical protein J7E96_19835 [Streptomyces sp. ISL-96]|uniref:COG4315 family predicted lipoprotein n=1 Tax=Streptomyces sp. ISL-96 TaxID=2819191 RepID=UPI001BE9B78C|nr:hypothetical protein [Streptomyces sp. ISL-96]MBT2490725.1 hypothetical protein [Streptomyces sp. ISL-96]